MKVGDYYVVLSSFLCVLVLDFMVDLWFWLELFICLIYMLDFE